MELTTWGRRGRTALKRFLYSQLSVRDGVLMAVGRERPLVRFTIEASPPSVYLNFAVAPDRLAAFERELDPPLPLASIVCLEGDDPVHCLTLNVYRVSGLANGLRAEWSTYVRGATGRARYLVVEAQTEKWTIDPVDIFVRPGHVQYRSDGGTLALEVGSEGNTRLTASIADVGNAPLVHSTPEWVGANDFIYWRNGVCDRTFYDSGMANARTRGVDPRHLELTNDTPWSRFIEPTPRSIVVYDHAIELAISPWWNIDGVG